MQKNEQDKNNINIQNEDIIKENSVKKESEAHQKPEAPMPEREGEDDLFNNIWLKSELPKFSKFIFIS